MAEEENTAEDTVEVPKDNTMKLMIIMFLAFTLVSAGSVAAVVMLLGGENSAAATAEAGTDDVEASETAAVEEPEPEPVVEKKPAHYYTIKPVFVVNYFDHGKSHYLQVGVDVMTRDESIISTVEAHLPRIKNDLVKLFAEQEFAVLATSEGKEQLQSDALAVVQNVVKEETGKKGVEKILFTSFVMQ